MKKCEIIQKNQDFSRIINQGKTVKNKYYSIYYLKTNIQNFYGITVPTKLGNAVIRNKNKRQIKNILDKNKNIVPKSYEYVIILKRNIIDLSYNDKEKMLISLLERIDN